MKKRVFKKILSILFSSVLIFSFASCGKMTKSGKNNSTEKSDSGNEDAEAADEAPKIFAEFSPQNSWYGENGNYIQYDVTIYNNASEKITDWSLDIECPDDMVVDQNWNTTISLNNGIMNIVPYDYAKTIEPGTNTEGLGIIVADSLGTPLSKYKLSYKVEGSSDIISFSGVSGENASTDSSGSIDAKEDDKLNRVVKVADSITKLHVEGTKLMNENGEAVRLQGISTLGLAWYPQYVDETTFKSFKEDWGINVIRLAMYTQEQGGYCVGDETNKQNLKDIIDKGVQAATDLGLYVIIDWHILSDGNPLTYEEEAIQFFDEMSKKYASYPNVLYEICNEPNNSNWTSEIKPYAETIIPVIRQNSPDSIIIVGTNTWCQDVDDVISDPIDDKNVMYTLHFYAATHKKDIRDKVEKTLEAGVPIFITECSICDANGNGSLDLDSANQWKNFINESGLSFIEWSLSNKDESSAILVPSCTKISDFTDSDYTDSAKYYREWMRENAGM